MQTVVAIGEIGKLAGVGDTEFDIVQIINLSAGIEDLVEPWLFGVCDVDDDESMFSTGDEGPCACDVEISCFGQRENGGESGIGGISDIEDFESFGISYEAVAKLEFDGAGSIEKFLPEDAHDSRFFRILNINDDKAGVAADPCVVSEDGDGGGTTEDLIGIEHDIFIEEVVGRVAVEECSGTDHNETFVEVGGVEVGIHFCDGCFVVFRFVRASGIRGDCCGSGDVCGEGGFDIEALSDRRDGCSDDAFGEAFMFDEGDVIDPDSSVSAGGVAVFSADLEVENAVFSSGVEELSADVVSGVFVGVVQQFSMMDMFCVSLGIDIVMHGTADDSLRFIAFGDSDSEQAMFSGGDPCITADEVHVVGALHEELRHEGVVVIVSGEVAIGAGLCFALAADSMWNIGAEGDSTESFGGDRLLLCVDGFTVEVVGRDMDSAGGA